MDMLHRVDVTFILKRLLQYKSKQYGKKLTRFNNYFFINRCDIWIYLAGLLGVGGGIIIVAISCFMFTLSRLFTCLRDACSNCFITWNNLFYLHLFYKVAFKLGSSSNNRSILIRDGCLELCLAPY